MISSRISSPRTARPSGELVQGMTSPRTVRTSTARLKSSNSEVVLARAMSSRPCAVCGVALPPASRRITCSDRCRQRRHRRARSWAPAWALTPAEAKERLAELAPSRLGPPPERVLSLTRDTDDPLDRLLDRLIADDLALLERLRDGLA